jgi:RHS repeat-associated protein
MNHKLLSSGVLAFTFLGALRSLNADCGCSTGAGTVNGIRPGHLDIIYTSSSTNLGVTPGPGDKLRIAEVGVTDADDKPQGGSGFGGLLTPPVGAPGGASMVAKHYVRGGPGYSLNYGGIDSPIHIESSSTDVYHPVELSYEGNSSTSDYREHMVVTPPAGCYMISSLVASNTTGGWTTCPNNVIQNPEASGSYATFVRLAFVNERGDPHHEPGEFTFPELVQTENTLNNSTLGELMAGFTCWLGNDQASETRRGRSWGRLVASEDLLSDVGAHTLRFITSHSKVNDGGSPLVKETIDASSRIYQIKTAAVLLDVRETVTSNRGTPTNYADDLRKVTISITTHADAGSPDGNGIYPQPSTPKHGALQFEQTERDSNGFTFKTLFRQFAPGANPSSATPISVYEYSAEDVVAEYQRKVTIKRGSLETEVIENIVFAANNNFSEDYAVRMETRRSHLGSSTSGSLLATSRAMFEMTTRGEQLIRTEKGSVSGSALPADSWAGTECLEWTTQTYHSDTGRQFLTENSKGEWSQSYFFQDRSFLSSVPSWYPALTEGNRYWVTVSPEKLKSDSLATHISSGRVAITGAGAASSSQLDSSLKHLTTLIDEERFRGKVVSLSTVACSIVGTGTGATVRSVTTRRRDPQATTPVTEVTTRDAYVVDNTDIQKRGRVFLTENPDGTKDRLEISSPEANIIRSRAWVEPSSGTYNILDAVSETDPSGRTTAIASNVVSVTAGSGSTTLQGAATSAAVAFTNDGTTPSISIATTTRDGLQMGQRKFDPGLRKLTDISVEGIVTETLYDEIGRETKATHTAGSGVTALVTPYTYTSRAGGGRIQRVRRGPSDSVTVPAGEIQADNAARRVLVRDAAGLDTSLSYGVNGAGNKITTFTRPTSSTSIQETSPAGDQVSLSGTGCVCEDYAQFIVGEAADTVTPPSWITSAQTLTHLRRRSVKVGSARWTHTVIDGLGRTLAVWGSGREELYVYNSGGQLIRVEFGPAIVGGTTTARTPLRCEYDGLGRVVKTGFSLDGNGTLDAGSGSGTDQVSLTAYSLVQIGGTGPWWEKTEKQHYKNNGGSADIINESTTYELLKMDSTNKVIGETRTLTGDGDEMRVQTVIDTSTLERKILTTNPGISSNTAATIYRNGLLYSYNTFSVQEPVIYYFDPYWRLTGQRDPMTQRNDVIEYNAQGLVSRTVDLAGNATFYEYYGTGVNGAGQLKKVTHADGSYTSYVYNALGKLTEQTGSADYPARYTYDATDGWLTTLKTYRDSSAAGNPLTGTSTYQSLTTWTYDAATGLVTDKTDDSSKVTSYTYWTGTRMLKERKWARFVTGTTRVTTKYDYDAAGQLATISYNDGTTSVARTYDRAGGVATVTDDAGLTTFTRSNTGYVTGETVSTTAAGGDPEHLNGLTVARTVNSYGQLTGVDASWSGILSANNGRVTATYSYNSTTGRLSSITNGTLSVAHTYVTNSDLPAERTYSVSGSGIFEQQYGYDEAGRLNKALSRDVSPSTIHAAYYYTYDNRDRQSRAIREDGVQWNYGYDSRGQVTSAKMKTGGDYLAGRQWEYDYDAIGNLLTAKSGGDSAGTGLRTATYTPNALNQHSSVTNPQTFDVNGTATNTATDTNGITVAVGSGTAHAPDAIQPGTNGVTARWHREKTATSGSSTAATWDTVNVKEGGTLKNSGIVKLPPATQSPTHDYDGNLTADGTWGYTWDAENRLTSMELAALPQGTGAPTVYRRLEFAYDSSHRRIQKKVLERPNSMSSWTQVACWRYAWDGRNCLLRMKYISSAWTWEQAYVWGPDLSGSWQGAGGTGGLLAQHQNLGGGVYQLRFAGDDGKGNVTTLADGTNGQLLALYEYDPFGNEIRHASTASAHADDNPFRFSTKPVDDETGLIYFGFRYYSPGSKRWISRDPAEESGGLNTYQFCYNDGLNFFDDLGHQGTKKLRYKAPSNTNTNTKKDKNKKTPPPQTKPPTPPQSNPGPAKLNPGPSVRGNGSRLNPGQSLLDALMEELLRRLMDGGGGGGGAGEPQPPAAQGGEGDRLPGFCDDDQDVGQKRTTGPIKMPCEGEYDGLIHGKKTFRGFKICRKTEVCTQTDYSPTWIPVNKIETYYDCTDCIGEKDALGGIWFKNVWETLLRAKDIQKALDKLLNQKHIPEPWAEAPSPRAEVVPEGDVAIPPKATNAPDGGGSTPSTTGESSGTGTGESSYYYRPSR